MASDPPDLGQPHLAIGLHFKRFPGRDEVWHNAEQQWYPLSELATHVRIYDDRVSGWFLDCAGRLPHDGFIVLMIAVSYFEGNEQYREGREPGRRESGAFFRAAFGRAFPELEGTRAVQTFYEDARCGLFHDGITRRRIRVSNSLPQAVTVAGEKLLISPNKVLERVREYHNEYIEELFNPANTERRTRFEELWHRHWPSEIHL